MYKIFRTNKGIVVEHDQIRFLVEDEWDAFINDDQLFSKINSLEWNELGSPIDPVDLVEIFAPILSQEVWGSGVTYLRSKAGRQEESTDSNASDLYARVYGAERPELFFKSTGARVVHPGQPVRIRADSSWNVPEPELTLLVTSNAKIVGYTIGNDMSSRSIEGENPLYLPQAKTYDGSAAIGPCIWVPAKPIPLETEISIAVDRLGSTVFSGETQLTQIKRTFEELVGYLFRECSFPKGCFLMTGTGIVPGREFTLEPGDMIKITIEPIGTLINSVA